jgi:hypothetical protein
MQASARSEGKTPVVEPHWNGCLPSAMASTNASISASNACPYRSMKKFGSGERMPVAVAKCVG